MKSVMLKFMSIMLATLLICSSNTNCQNRLMDTLIEKLNNYGASKSQTSLFIHYDKNVYTNHEYVWFTGYLLNHDEDLSAYQTLSIALVRNENRKIWIENKFVIKNGISSGCIFLPDSLTAGNYNLVAFTNRISNNQPEDIFLQPITIKNVFSDFSTSLTLLDSTDHTSDTIRVLIKARTPDLLPLEGAQINYIVGTGTSQGKEHKLVLNKTGEAIVLISRKNIPVDNNMIYVQVNSKGILKDMSLTLPTIKREPSIRFYPEAGYLINETSCKVGWEVKTAEGNPVSVSAFLYEDNQVIDTIQTSGYGMGKFNLKPKIGSIYTVRISSGDINGIYKLLSVIETTATLSIENAIVADTLSIKLHNTNAANKLFLIIHKFNQLFLAFEVNRNSSEQVLKIPLSKIPKGIAEITLIDNLERPLAERLFFAHYDKMPELHIEHNREVFDKKEQVEITIKLDSIKTKSKNALVSIACVQSNRIDIRKANDIESYTYLKSVIEDIPFKQLPLKSAIESNDYLEDVLLIKGWRRYNWKSLINAKEGDSLTGKKSLEMDGVLLKNMYPVSKPTQINVLADSAFGIITTNAKGIFKLNPEEITVRSQKTVKLFMNKENEAPYSFKLNDQFKQMHENLASNSNFINYEDSIKSFNTGELLLKKDESANQLQEVIVKAKIKNDEEHLNNFASKLNVNECGDYVCRNNILNCREHSVDVGNRPPIIGEKYITYMFSGKLITYHGCQNLVPNLSKINLNGVFLNKDFYQSDNVSPLITEPEYISTLYWSPSVLLNTDIPVKILFKTGIINGKFKIIIQGRTDDDVIYQESFITVGLNK